MLQGLIATGSGGFYRAEPFYIPDMDIKRTPDAHLFRGFSGRRFSSHSKSVCASMSVPVNCLSDGCAAC